MAAAVAPLDLEGGADDKVALKPLPRSVLLSCALSFALSLLLPAKSGLPGYALGWAVCNLAGLALHRAARSAARLAQRDLAVDVFRGATLFSIVAFHAAWSLRRAGLATTCSHALPADWPRMDFMMFLAALIGGHAVLIWLGHVSLEGALLFFPWYSWSLVTTWNHWASKTGMALMMFSAGYSSKLLFDRARDAGALRRYFLRVLRHIALLALVSAGITAFSYAKSPRSYSCTGAVHLLLTGAVAQLPFLPFPRLALAVGSAGLLLDTLGGQYIKPRGCGGFDHQPFQLGLSMQAAMADDVQRDLNTVFNEVRMEEKEEEKKEEDASMEAKTEAKRRSDSEATQRSKSARKEEEEKEKEEKKKKGEDSRGGPKQDEEEEEDEDEDGEHSRRRKKKNKKPKSKKKKPEDYNADEQRDVDGLKTPAKNTGFTDIEQQQQQQQQQQPQHEQMQNIQAQVNRLTDAGRQTEREIGFLKKQMRYTNDHLRRIDQDSSGKVVLIGGIALAVPHYVKTQHTMELFAAVGIGGRDLTDVKWNGRSRMVEATFRNEYVAKMALKALRDNSLDRDALGKGTFAMIGQAATERDRLRPHKVLISACIEEFGHENYNLLKTWDEVCSIALKQSGKVLVQSHLGQDNRYVIQIADEMYEQMRNCFKEMWNSTFSIESDEDSRSLDNFVWPIRFVPTTFTINAYDEDEPLGRDFTKGKGKGKKGKGKDKDKGKGKGKRVSFFDFDDASFHNSGNSAGSKDGEGSINAAAGKGFNDSGINGAGKGSSDSGINGAGKGSSDSGINNAGKGSSDSGINNAGKGFNDSGINNAGKGINDSGINAGKGFNDSGINAGKGTNDSGINAGKGSSDSGINAGKGYNDGTNAGKGYNDYGINSFGKGYNDYDINSGFRIGSHLSGHFKPATYFSKFDPRPPWQPSEPPWQQNAARPWDAWANSRG